jgi:type 1 fimbriae regulatory protein FimB/type 1 fimbriae regulatory protein FimE
MVNSALQLVAPINEMRTVRAGRKRNARLRTHNYLTEAEVERLTKRLPAIATASATRPCSWLFSGTACGPLRLVHCAGPMSILSEVNVHVHRVKNGDPSVHPLSGRELCALRRLKREQEPASPFVFTSERQSIYAGRYSQACGAGRRRG